MAKECVNKAYEVPLSQGLAYEKKVFWATFATVLTIILFSDVNRKTKRRV